ncbi:unnamed protein product [Citrullus colocynthis]|uniref:Uncharacterized protein n=1 Tax=Citrullus colocynthis TaxID=252529 RepID=A0ABP0YBJ6_9ROSI
MAAQIWKIEIECLFVRIKKMEIKWLLRSGSQSVKRRLIAELKQCGMTSQIRQAATVVVVWNGVECRIWRLYDCKRQLLCPSEFVVVVWNDVERRIWGLCDYEGEFLWAVAASLSQIRRATTVVSVGGSAWSSVDLIWHDTLGLGS